jgi:putative transposase
VVRALVDAKTDITLAEIRAELHERGIVVHALSTIHHALRRIGLTRKNVWPAPSASGLCEVT